MTYKFKTNFISGLLVSFIALPLCIAIASASLFPIMSGITTAIIGGIIVSQISGNKLAINGPAAGLIVIIVDSVEKLGNGNHQLGYTLTLGAIIVASILQFLTSFTKIPIIMRKFPEYVIRGMMMSIGLIVLLKQFFILANYQTPKVSIIEFIQYIPLALLGMQIESFSIGFFVIFVIVFWKKFLETKNRIFKIIPVYLLVIALGIMLAKLFDLKNNQHFLFQQFAHPSNNNFINISSHIKDAINFPNFELLKSQIYSFKFWFSVFTIYAVASLETILSTIALDKIAKTHTELKKDLRAIAIGNFICGMLGGLPMITEIVRSSANVSYGASNKFSNFFHGLCLLLMVIFFNSYLNLIPLSVLAGMLIIIALNMINIQNFIQIFRDNKKEFIVIIFIILATLYVDLLVGIVIGLILHFIFNHEKKHKKT
ncbi:MAG: SulP family inorganic anion transporter [Proteobacteria bacterium]|nr:SulP family inorganic anion transporter [Pseudomonadota bacterium]NCA28640.1 SulP family inorganic anion transporter [Pseudomonadota bacterium]